MKGIKHDKEKLRWDLLPIEQIENIVKVMTFGCKKYGDNNWKDLENGKDRYYAAALRHMVSYRKGTINDDETGLPHLAHALCCLVFLSWFEENKEK